MDYIKTHVAYLVMFAVVAFAAWKWLGEHDSLLRAEQTEKLLEKDVEQLRKDQADRDKAAQEKIALLQRLAAKVQTPAQVVQALPQVVDLPKQPTLTPSEDLLFPKESVLPLFHQLAEGKECAVELVAVKADLKDEKAVSSKKQEELDGYKKAAGHKSFFGKLWGGTKAVVPVVLAVILTKAVLR